MNNSLVELYAVCSSDLAIESAKRATTVMLLLGDRAQNMALRRKIHDYEAQYVKQEVLKLVL